MDFTTVVAVDELHAEELRLVWPTWRHHRSELLGRPMLLVCDGDIPLAEWEHRLEFLEHPRKRLVPWRMPGVSQREKMLTSLVRAVALHVTTPWYLKLDTDTVAAGPADWLQPGWFEPDEASRLPVFISQPWGYTKPADAIERLDDWGDTIPALQQYPRLNLPVSPGSSRVRSRRIISWCFFGNTAWTEEAASYCSGRLPIASQDTYLWYCAARSQQFYRAFRMTSLGWRHIHRRRTLEAACRTAMQKSADELLSGSAQACRRIVETT